MQVMSSPILASEQIGYRRDEVHGTTLVNTPGGQVPPERIHLVPNGACVHQADGFIHIIAQNGTKLHTASVSGNSSTARHGSVSPHVRRSFGSGYVAYTWWNNPSSSPIAHFTTTWTVPDSPQNIDGQLLYLFNSMEPDSFNAILQPVLQYGVSPAGGGDYWSVASWWIVGSEVYHSSLTPVTPGQSLQGVMTLITPSDGSNSYNYSSAFTGIPDSEISISSLQELTYAWEALEIYTASGATDLPRGRTAMGSINLFTQDGQTPLLFWDSSDDGNDGFKVEVVADGAVNGQVDLVYPLQ
ncbi:hypothetical protein JR316_0011139 [Psilocybe cubensis]|uniref:Uncharacterized protein n=2 Tax=Psilocybe cubensis TaxID=181762 RepID=A0A8H8CF50_PSICU|nr:hypothetical protein JR316_0011139 [Psilocybe cubensis]KAH9477220.1 hypothetical protein JR316_0011139 [Psilocybe cubensis]